MREKSRLKVTVRLLPVLALVLMLVLGLHIGKAWKDINISFGTRSEAQTAQPAPPAATGGGLGNGTEAAPTPSQENTVSTEAPAATATNDLPAEAVPGTGSTTNEIGAAEPAEASQTDVVSSNTTQTNTVPIEGADEAAAASGPINDPLDLSDEEIDVLQQLAKRREELEIRARQLDEREALVSAAEGRMEQKMVELKALQATVEGLLNQRAAEEEAQMKSLVKIYENMKPKAAAQVFEELDLEVLLGVVSRMNERKLAPVLALVSPTRAKEVTYELAQRHALPINP